MEEFLYSRTDTIRLLLEAYLKILRVNLTTEDYDEVKVSDFERDENKGFAANISAWLKGFAESGMVYKDDIKTFLYDTDIDRLRAAFNEGRDRLCFRYRRMNDEGVFRWVKMCIRKSDDYTDENQLVILYIEDIDDEIAQTEVIEQQHSQLKEAFDSAVAANSAKSDFMSRMSHDIRTPLNGIIGMTAIAGAHIDDQVKVGDCLSKINSASKHLLSLINDILDLSKIESGKLKLTDNEFNLPELMDDLVVMVQSQIQERAHDLNVYVKNVTHENVYGDDVRLRQVFVNLLSNAIKYTPNGGKIALTLEETQSGNPHFGDYRFICEDNGYGMSEEFLQHLFEPFERADNPETSGKQGTGLGMTISQNIIQMMGGSIRVESELGRGSKFYVNFKLRIKESDIGVEESLVNLPVLVVDDDKMSCESTCYTLEELGMKGEYALSGPEAIEKVQAANKAANDYFACLIDWVMPGMDGLETTRRIRQIVGPEVTIILISAFDWTEIEQEALKAGANGFISKPIFKSRLRAAFTSANRETPEENKTDTLDKFAQKDFHGKRVLLVEDNELNREIAQEVISMTGATVECAADGKIGYERFMEDGDGHYDMIFMDIQMPVMNGYESAKAIRALENDYAKNIPIIALTANAFAEDIAKVREAGMNQHMAKPIDFDQLLSVMDEYIGN